MHPSFSKFRIIRGTVYPVHVYWETDIIVRVYFSGCKGVYPQSNGSLTIVSIDESKGFVDLWVHLFLAMECIH